jgi:hypothetical protein
VSVIPQDKKRLCVFFRRLFCYACVHVYPHLCPLMQYHIQYIHTYHTHMYSYDLCPLMEYHIQYIHIYIYIYVR